LKTISNPQAGFENPEPRIHAYSERGNIHRLQAFEFGNVEEASRDRITSSRTCSSTKATPICRSSSTPRSPRSTAKAAHPVVLDPVPHYVHRCLARCFACPLRRSASSPAERRRLRRQVRRLQSRDGGRQAAMLLGRPVKICLNREEVFYMHRGRHPVLMKARTGRSTPRRQPPVCTCSAGRRLRLRRHVREHLPSARVPAAVHVEHFLAVRQILRPPEQHSPLGDTISDCRRRTCRRSRRRSGQAMTRILRSGHAKHAREAAMHIVGTWVEDHR